MTSMRPYLLRALHEWIIDNSLTPYLLVNADHEQVAVPQQHVENGKIILNLSTMAVQSLIINDDGISFRARFSGRPFSVFVPTVAVLAIYARENGKGMFFQPEEDTENTSPPQPEAPPPPRRSKPVLKLVK